MKQPRTLPVLMLALFCVGAWLLGCAREAAAEPESQSRELGAMVDVSFHAEGFSLARAEDGALELRVRARATERSWRWQGASWVPQEERASTTLSMRSIVAWEDSTALAAMREEPQSFGALLTEGGAAIGWSPQAVFRADGSRSAVAYDTSREGDADVVLRDASGAETVLAGTSAFEAKPTLAMDGAGRLWAAWEIGADEWGRHPELHGARQLTLAVREPDGRWKRAPEMALLSPVAGVAAGAPGAGPFVSAESPLLLADAEGGIWLFFRSMVASTNPEDESRSTRKVIWQQRFITCGTAGWGAPRTLSSADGPQQPSLSAAALPDGSVLVVYGSDQRREPSQADASWSASVALGWTVRTAVLRSALGAPRVEGWEPLATGRSAPRLAPPPADPDLSLVPEGMLRLWGDLHRHTEYSRCKMDLDGMLQDQWRYALDVAALDFLAVTDHKGHLDYRQWFTQLEAVRDFDLPGRFVALYGLESVLPDGHRNLIARDFSDAMDLFDLLARGGNPAPLLRERAVLVIPHQIADRQSPFTWRQQYPESERLVELFQSRRGSYESETGPRRTLIAADQPKWAQDHLAQGFRFGFVGSSDHQGVLSAYTAALARGRDRNAIFEALSARRCYAATAKIALDARLGSLEIGAAGAVAADAALEARIAAGAPLAWVEVLRDGAVARRWEGEEAAPLWFLLRTGLARDAERGLSLRVLGGRILDAEPWHQEPGDSFTVLGDSELRFDALADTTDEDGVRFHVQADPGAELVLEVSLLSGQASSSLKASEIAEGTRVLRLGRARVGLEGGRPSLGRDRLQLQYAPGDWKAGEQVYLRLQREDGEVAWTSPFFLDAE